LRIVLAFGAAGGSNRQIQQQINERLLGMFAQAEHAI
jgi:hypothetical protein